MAEFVAGFDAPNPDWPDAGLRVYRIRIWLDGLDDRPRAQYDLHPEEGNKPITRYAIGPLHEQWLNTRNDYKIRVRSSDGFEWQVGGVLAALRLRYDMQEDQAAAKGADLRARQPVPILANPKGTATKEGGKQQDVSDAIDQLTTQTKQMASGPNQPLQQTGPA
jgi:hypothetical protein